jgi:2-polyprenyl-3-methyl-5-hydroxy-6-metoxy-1,4-benzoquinol methylase
MNPTKPRSNLSDYYDPIRLNPVGHDISRKESLLLHERKRRSLLEHHLKLPFPMWRGLRVLEFGPASGENAVVLARAGARMTFVEPLDYLIQELKEKFASFQLSDRIEAVHHEVLEKFQTSDRFDVVLAEGFVHFLDDPAGGLRKLSSFVSPGGFLIVSVLNTPGTFIEFIKAAYVDMTASILGRRGDQEKLELVRALFADQFKRINHSRGFEKWIRDTVLNPLYRPRHFVDFPEALAALPEDFILYSSWPNYLHHDDLVWHKNIKDVSTVRQESLDSHSARAAHFIHSVPQRPDSLALFDPADGRRIMKALDTCYEKINRGLVAHAGPAAHLAALSGLRRALARHPQARQSLRVVDEAISLFQAARKARDEKAFVKAWADRKLFREIWGSPGHYMVFEKTGEPA